MTKNEGHEVTQQTITWFRSVTGSTTQSMNALRPATCHKKNACGLWRRHTQRVETPVPFPARPTVKLSGLVIVAQEVFATPCTSLVVLKTPHYTKKNAKNMHNSPMVSPTRVLRSIMDNSQTKRGHYTPHPLSNTAYVVPSGCLTWCWSRRESFSCVLR